jgi:hypothetical protein
MKKNLKIKNNFLDQIKKLGPDFYKKPLFIISVVATILLIVVVVLGFKVKKLQTSLLSANLKNKQISLVDPNKSLIESVGKLIILPIDEQPTVATVADLDKLKDQPFFAQAQLGDKVLIYQNAKKAILYRPSENKIIELAPLNNTTQDQSAASAQNVMTLQIINGTGVGGSAGLFKNKLLGDKSISVISSDTAKSLYAKSQLYVVNPNKFGSQIKKLRELSSAEIISTLPDGEVPSQADAVLILGKN